MEFSTANIIIAFVIHFVISLDIVTSDNFDVGVFHPVRNYKEWNKINVFGVCILTLLINVLLLPFAIIFWVGYFIHTIFTIGRRD